MLANCQAARESLTPWEFEFIQSVSLQVGDKPSPTLTDKQIYALLRIWKKLPASAQDLTPIDENKPLDSDMPF